MEQEKIRELLDKYFGGETSEDEERILREYLGSASAPDSMTREFGYLAMKPEQVPETSEGFETRLREITRPEITMHHPDRRRQWITIITTAAAVAAGAWLLISNLSLHGERDTYSDPAIAMAEVRSILLDISERMNTGTAQLEQVSTITAKPEELNVLSTINDLVGKNLSRLRYLDDLQNQGNKTETK